MSATVTAELTFPEGLVGCPEWQHFVLESGPDLAPVVLLNSTDEPALSLPAVNPWLVRSDYAPVLGEADRLALAPESEADLQWLAVLNIQPEPLVMTANLLGPLVVNRRTGQARQVILSNSGYAAAHPVRVLDAPACQEVTHAGPDAAA